MGEHRGWRTSNHLCPRIVVHGYSTANHGAGGGLSIGLRRTGSQHLRIAGAAWFGVKRAL